MRLIFKQNKLTKTRIISDFAQKQTENGWKCKKCFVIIVLNKKLRGKKARKGRIMTKKERVLHAFHNEPVDRVPIAFGIIFTRR